MASWRLKTWFFEQQITFVRRLYLIFNFYIVNGNLGKHDSEKLKNYALIKGLISTQDFGKNQVVMIPLQQW